MKQKAHPWDQWRYMTNKTSPKGKAAVLKWHHQSIRHSHLSPKSNHGKLWGKKSCYPFTYASTGNIMFLSLPSPLLILPTDRPDSGTSKVSICQVKQMLHLAWKGGKKKRNRKGTEKCTPMATAQGDILDRREANFVNTPSSVPVNRCSEPTWTILEPCQVNGTKPFLVSNQHQCFSCHDSQNACWDKGLSQRVKFTLI